MHTIKFFLMLPLCLWIAGCVSTPVSNRSALILVPFSQEVSLGQQSYQAILSKEKESTDQKMSAIVRRVGERIAAVSDLPRLKWESRLIESDQYNAFALPGGKIAVYSAMLPICENEAGLATVVAHEVAHVVARHGAQRMSQDLLIDTALLGASIGLSGNPNSQSIMGALGVGATYGIQLPYSRAHETEADEIGLIYMARAGYDPNEAVKFWKRFSRVTQDQKPPEFLSTHPADSTRINSIRGMLPRALAEYRKTRTQYGLGVSLTAAKPASDSKSVSSISNVLNSFAP